MTPEPSNEYQKLVEAVARAIHDGPLGADDYSFDGSTQDEKNCSEWCREVARAALSALSVSETAGRVQLKLPHAGDDGSFQARVQPWMMQCFGPEISADRVERGDRLLEEVFELLQSGGYDPARIVTLASYVWNRPAGEPSQEAGGVMVTLAAYCLAHGLDMHEAGETELARILQPEIVEKIRAKQARKAREIPFSPLPTPPNAVRGETEIPPLSETADQLQPSRSQR